MENNSLDIIIKNHIASTDNIVKVKNYDHQVLVKQKNYYYKIYEEDKRNLFFSVVRNKLTEIYRKRGIDFSIKTFEKNNKIYDFEKKIEVQEIKEGSMPFNNILKEFTPILSELYESLELKDILKQLKAKSSNFENCYELVLWRGSINKSIDYGIDKFGNIILLDDADWFLCFLDEFGNPMEVTNTVIDVTTSYGNFVMSTAKFLDRPEEEQLKKYRAPRLEWTMQSVDFEEKKELMYILADRHYQMLKDNLTFINNEIKYNQLGEEKYMGIANKQINDDNLLYTNNTGRKSFQWELWQCCDNLCNFCYLGKENRHTDKERQLKSIADCNLAIDHLNFNEYNNVSFIGGEFFQGQLNDKEVYDGFMALIKRTFQLYIDKKIGSIWIAATLTRADQTDLRTILDMAEEMGVKPKEEYGASGLWICTSWDAEGRFHTEQARINWENNMEMLHNDYPWLKLNCTTIITETLCKLYLEDKWAPESFSQKYHTSLFFKQPGIPSVEMDYKEGEEQYGDAWLRTKQKMQEQFGIEFYPHRSTFLKFLQKFYMNDYPYFNRLFNIKYRADELHRNFNFDESDKKIAREKNDKQEEPGVKTLPCGHLFFYAPYIDSNACCYCDKQMVEGDI